MKTITYTLQSIISGHHNKTLLGIVVMLFGAYCFFIAQTVVAINERKMLYSDVREEQMKVSDLETRYFAMTSTIDLEKTKELGFQDITSPRFAYTQKTSSETVALAR